MSQNEISVDRVEFVEDGIKHRSHQPFESFVVGQKFGVIEMPSLLMVAKMETTAVDALEVLVDENVHTAAALTRVSLIAWM